MRKLSKNPERAHWRVQQELLHCHPHNKRFQSVYAQPKFPVVQHFVKETPFSSYVFWACIVAGACLLWADRLGWLGAGR